MLSQWYRPMASQSYMIGIPSWTRLAVMASQLLHVDGAWRSRLQPRHLMNRGNGSHKAVSRWNSLHGLHGYGQSSTRITNSSRMPLGRILRQRSVRRRMAKREGSAYRWFEGSVSRICSKMEAIRCRDEAFVGPG